MIEDHHFLPVGIFVVVHIVQKRIVLLSCVQNIRCISEKNTMSLKHSVVKFKFEDFESLPSEQGVQVSSEEVADCRGNIWKLNIYPGGDSESEEGMVHMSLFNTGIKMFMLRLLSLLGIQEGK